MERGRGELHVAGLVASAGGLDAFKKFFTAMPADSGIAFVLIPHLDPTHASLMVDLLSRRTSMPVVEATEDIAVEANRVYIIPPNKDMTIAGGVLRLTGPVERSSWQTSIDLFLRSLADDQLEKAIAIVLSGTGSHGTLGLKAVKAAGGLALVQDPGTANYPSMPESATGLADYVLPVEQMPDTLVRYMQHFHVNGGRGVAAVEETPDLLNQVLALLCTRTKFDFRGYRRKTLARRLERRIGLSHFANVADYLAHLRDDPDEVKLLARDLLISVTRFFRDPVAFRTLETKVLAPLIWAQDADVPFRVWIPGCATGEEPYAVAMLLLEQKTAAQNPCRLQIFATDVDEHALGIARRGIFPVGISADVSPERLVRFFTRVDESSFQISKQVRETVTFAVQNLIADSPFSRMDLIVCRNLLIYLEPVMQKKILTHLHFALKEGGTLFLGPSETIGPLTDLFEPVSREWRIYRRIGRSRAEDLPFAVMQRDPRHATREPTYRAEAAPRFAELAQNSLLRRFGLACVVINRNCEVLHFAGPTEDYLVQPGGSPTQNLLSLARSGLESKLRVIIHRATRDNALQSIKDVKVRHGDDIRRVNIAAEPLNFSKQTEGLLLISFHGQSNSSGETPAKARTPANTAKSSGETLAEAQTRADTAEADLLRQLELELETTRDDLQSTLEEWESANEELNASNEEVMSMNEELQSVNEELETSREELQSFNEELSTVNNQLQDKIEEVQSATNDMANLLDTTEIATVFLDARLRIKLFTPASTRLFNLIASDRDRSIGDITNRFIDGELLNDAQHVLRDLTPSEKEVRTDDGRWYVRRIVTYQTVDNRIDGVVITFVDISDRKKAADAMVRRLAAVVESSADAIFSKDLAGIIETWNPAAERLYGYSRDEAVGRSVKMIVPEDRTDEWTRVMDMLARGESVEQLETERLRKNGERVVVALTVSPMRDGNGKVESASVTVRDITEHKRAEEELRASEAQSQAILASLPANIAVIDCGGTVTAVNPAWEAFALANGGNPERCNVGVNYLDACRAATGEGEKVAEQLQAILDGTATSFTMEYPCHSGTQQRWFLLQAVPLRHNKGGAVVTHTNITNRIKAENALRAAHHRLEAVVETAPSLIVVTDRGGRVVHFNRACEEVTGYRRDEVLGETILDRFVPTGWRSVVAARFANLHAPELREPHENPWLTRTGDERLIEWRCLTLPQPEETSPWFLVAFGIDITERKRTEVTLREREARLTCLFDALPVSVGIIDVDGKVVVSNPEMRRYLPTGVIPSRDADRVGRWRGTHPDGRPIEPADFAGARALRGERVVPGIEFRYVLDDGTEVWTQVAAVPLLADGRISGHVVVVSDIDAAKRAEERLALQARQQANIAALGQKALIGEPLQDLMDEAVRTVSDILKIELVRVLELLPGGDRLLLRAGVGWKQGLVGTATVSAGRESHAGYTLLSSEPVVVADLAAETRFDGPPLLTEHGVVSGISCTILGTGGEPYGVLGAHTRSRREFTPDDVTFLEGIANVLGTVIQRRQLEESRRDSEERLRSILNTAADGIITIDAQGVIQSANPAAERMFGYAAAEMLGQNVKMLMPAPYRDEHDRYLARYQQTGEKHIIDSGREVEGRRKDGSTFPVDLAVSQVGFLNLFTGILRDISRRKELEQEVVEIASLEQQRIGQDLHDSVSQELTALSMLAGDLAETLQTDPSHGSKLVERLVLGLRRSQQELRAVMRGLCPVSVDNEGLMAALSDLANRTRQESKVRCTFDCPQPVLVEDNVIATHLYLIAQEAVHNAVKHARCKHIRIVVESKNDVLFLRVQDDGIGISDERPSPLLSPQEGESNGESAGLGLRIMRNRAAIIRATLTIEPTKPAGTLITCALPRRNHETE